MVKFIQAIVWERKIYTSYKEKCGGGGLYKIGENDMKEMIKIYTSYFNNRLV